MTTKDAITWDDLATAYDKHHGGRKARTLPMDTVFQWGESRTDLFRLGDDGYLYRVKEELK